MTSRLCEHCCERCVLPACAAARSRPGSSSYCRATVAMRVLGLFDNGHLCVKANFPAVQRRPRVFYNYLTAGSVVETQTLPSSPAVEAENREKQGGIKGGVQDTIVRIRSLKSSD